MASFVLVFYFLYLSVTRRALDVFNCNPVDPDDGYLYTEFTSIDCEAGLCRCDDPDELQAQLVPYAVLCIVFYSIGFPLYVVWVTWYYRIQIKLDQLLRAHDMGQDRANSPDTVMFTFRKCRSKSKKIYDIRKKHYQLYYHFKPGKVYWLVVILMRKFFIALIALFFRGNIVFMLATMLLVLFANYVLTAKHRPYMSTVERENVKENHRLKVDEAQQFIDADMPRDTIPKDSLMHFQLDPSIKRLVQKRIEANRRLGHHGIRNLSQAKNIHVANLKKSIVTYYFDYNTVEIVLIGCNIFLALVAIMFESGRFYYTDPETGIQTLSTDTDSQIFYNTVLVLAGFTLFGSLVYYGIVFTAEVLGKLPNVLVKCTGQKKRKQLSAFGLDKSLVFESNPMANGLNGQQLKELRDEEKRAQEDIDRMKKQKDEMMKTQQGLVEQNKRLKRDAMNKASSPKGRKNRVKKKKKEGEGAFGQKRVSIEENLF